MPTHLGTDSRDVTEIDDGYMRALVIRVVPPYNDVFEDAMQEARIARWLYRDKPNSYQANQIVWRCKDMLRHLNGRKHRKPHADAYSLDWMVQNDASSGPVPFADLFVEGRPERSISAALTLIDVKRALSHESKRDVTWLIRHARGETYRAIGKSAGYCEATVAHALSGIRKRLREAVAA